jgi:predicted nucleotide-binding protein
LSRAASAIAGAEVARQNVVFEFGFFAVALGRNRVAVLYEDGVELPSDVDGLLHIGWDGAGGWKLPLAKEPNAAGIDVKVKRLLGLTGAGPGPLWPSRR